jgi:organic radical activating enzyme
MPNNTLCVLPFNTLSIGQSGHQRLCCNALNGGLSNSDMPAPVTQRIELTWQHNSALQRVRSTMLAGYKPAQCERCWKLEDIGAESYRQINNTYRFPATYEKLLQGDATVKLERLELDFGNKCNLACRMCHPYSSSLLAQEINKDPANAYTQVDMEFLEKTSWVKRSRLFDVVREQGHDLKSVYIIGGEPLIMDEQEEFLDLLIELDFAKNISLEYNSNITTIGSKWYDKWSHFKEVNLNASIDGVEEYYEYVRWPAKWDKIYSNLQELKYWSKQRPNNKTCIHTTLSNLTMPSMKKVADILVGDLDFNIFVINVDHPTCMRPEVLPDSVRASIALDAAEHINSKFGEHYALSNMVKSLEKIAALPSPSDQDRQDFIKRMKFMDRHRKQNLLDLHPWFKEWYDVYQ